jgi:cobalt-zinc-cadmium efflux system outer membrane protein
LPQLAELLQLAIETRQDYQSERHRQEQFEWEQQAASRLRIPDPVVFAGIKRADDLGTIRYGPHIGVAVSIPLFDRGQNRVAELEAALRRLSYRQEMLSGQIESEVRGAYEELQMRRQAVVEYRQQAGQPGIQLEQIAKLAYQEGELGILELLDAYRIRRQSVLLLLELTAVVKQAEINLERAIGRPVLNPEVLP